MIQAGFRRRLVKTAVAGIGVCILLCAAAWLAFHLRFAPRIPDPRFAAPRDQADANRQDLQYLRTTFPSVDRSFSPQQQRLFDAELYALISRAADLSPGELAMGIAHAVALSDNGHTALSTSRLRHIPLRFSWFAEGLFVVQARADHADLLGFRVDKIGGVPPAAILEKLRDDIPGLDGYKRVRSVHFLDSPDALSGLHVIPNGDEVRLDLIGPAEERLSRTFNVPKDRVEPQAEANALFKHAPDCDVTCDWPHVLDHRTPPLYAQRAREGFFRAWIDEINALYVRVFAVKGVDGRPISGFFADTVSEARRRRPQHVIVDLRGNDGGNYFLSRSFTRRISQAVPGKVFIITDGGTFSAALVTAAFLKHFAEGRAMIVGEHVGDREQFWAEGGGAIALPNSTHRIWVATGYHDWEHGCRSWARCFWPNVLFGVAAGKLDVDLPAPLTFAAYASGRDDSLDAIRAFLHRSSDP
jgi:hypothetical protein